MRSAACEACRGAFAAVISVVSTSDRSIVLPIDPAGRRGARVQLVQGSSGTCLRCTPRLWRVGETGIAHFSPGTEKTLPWRRGLTGGAHARS
jgi:hypothetical protein